MKRLLLLLVAACGTPERTTHSANGEIAILRVFAPAPPVVGPPSEATMAVYATIVNRGAAADTLIAAETDAARGAGVHTRSMSLAPITVPPGEVVLLEPGGTHVMLEGLSRQFVAGDSVAFALVFRRAGRVPLVAAVVPYAQLDRTLRR